MIGSQKSTSVSYIGPGEKIVSIAAGGLLITRLAQKRSLVSVLCAALGADLIYRGVCGESLFDRVAGTNTAKKQKSGLEVAENAPQVRRAITIDKSAEELRALWSDPHNMSRIMGRFAEITQNANGGCGLTHWRMRTPFNRAVEWDAQATENDGGISWRSLPGTELPNQGEVTFNPGPDAVGTEVRLHMRFEPPLGSAGAWLMEVFRKGPGIFAGQALRRFKSLAETGEIPTLENNPSGRGSSDSF
jgi:uncharacterized membrane protein